MSPTGRPLVSTLRDAFVTIIESADSESIVSPVRSNVKETPRFKKLFQVPSGLIRRWEVDYPEAQPGDAAEHPAGDLYFRKHAFDLIYWNGPYNDIQQTEVDFVDILHEVFDAVVANEEVFSNLNIEITERTVTAPSHTREKLHGIFVHKGVLAVEVTARIFKPT